MPRIPFRPLASTSRFFLHVGLAVLAAWLVAMGSPAQAGSLPQGPGLRLRDGDAGTAGLRLKATRVDVNIAGVMAEVVVTQQYRHEGVHAVDAAYVFAGSPQAAVMAVTVRQGERVTDSRIQARPRLRIEAPGAPLGTLERTPLQDPPQGFLRQVAGIQPGEEVQVELRYTEPVAPSEGGFRFVFPRVTDASATFDLHMHLGAPLPLAAIVSPSHGIEVSGEDSTQAEVALADGGARDARDFVLDYRLGGERLAAGLMLYHGQGEQENFFLALVAPPAAIDPAQVRAREVVFVVGVSDSMRGEPLQVTRTVLRDLVSGLRPGDRFSLMQFTGASVGLGDKPMPATQAQVSRALKAVERLRGGGAADLVPALKRIAALPRDPELSRSVVLVTDGHVAVEGDVLRRVRKTLGGARVFTFGVGTSVNRPVVEALARAGSGESFIVEQPEAAAAQAMRLHRLIDAPVLTQLSARFLGLDVYDLDAAPLPDVMGQRPVWVSGKWRVSAQAGDADAPQGLLVLEGRSAAGAYREMVRAPAADPQAGPLRHLWAQRRLQQLCDQAALEGGHAQRDEITALGLKYGMATPYTSFPSGQALPRGHVLPVALAPAPAAVLASPAKSGVPEPGTWAMLGAASLLTLWAVCRRSRTRSDA